MPETSILDTNWLGRPRSVAAVLLESDGHNAIVDPGPESALGTLRERLAERGIAVADLNAILLTHIHLDHAGATGRLVRENPALEVYVHRAGLVHMADPSKLLASAERLWPGQLQHLYGETLPVPHKNLRVLQGGESLKLGARNIEVLYTPGHASHHVSYFDSSDGTVFVGDTTGFRVEGQPYVMPVAPPPDIDLELWNASLDAIAAKKPSRLCLTHFGFSNDPTAHIADYRKILLHWAEVAKEILLSEPDEQNAMRRFVDTVTAEVQKNLSPADANHALANVEARLSWLGFARYHRKRAKDAANAAG